jgi:hypothetical protein
MREDFFAQITPAYPTARGTGGTGGTTVHSRCSATVSPAADPFHHLPLNGGTRWNAPPCVPRVPPAARERWNRLDAPEAVTAESVEVSVPPVPPVPPEEEHGARVIDWQDGVRHLDVDRPPPGFPPLRWERFIDDAHIFIRDWARQADRLGWQTTAIFGVDTHAPWARIDKAGLVVLLDGGRVVAMSEDWAALIMRRGGRLTFYRQRHTEVEAVPVWEVRT